MDRHAHTRLSGEHGVSLQVQPAAHRVDRLAQLRANLPVGLRLEQLEVALEEVTVGQVLQVQYGQQQRRVLGVAPESRLRGQQRQGIDGLQRGVRSRVLRGDDLRQQLGGEGGLLHGRDKPQVNGEVVQLGEGQFGQVLCEEGAVAQLLHRGHAELLQRVTVVPTAHHTIPRPLEQHLLQHQHLAVVPLRRLLLRQHLAAPLIHLHVHNLLQPRQLLREQRRGHVGAATPWEQCLVLQEHEQVATCGELRQQLREQLHHALAEGERGGECSEVGTH